MLVSAHDGKPRKDIFPPVNGTPEKRGIRDPSVGHRRPPRSDRPAILLVDDDDRLRADLGELLTSAGFDVIGVADHHEALRIVESGRRLDLLMTDLVLPNGVSGFTTGRMAQLRRPGLNVLYISAYDHPVEEGANWQRVLKKPLVLARMIEQIEDLIC